MTPADYVAIVAGPTVAEFRNQRDDQRRAYLACITGFHILDHLAHAMRLDHAGTLCELIRRGCDGTVIKALNVVQGVCNGTKHAVTRPGKQLQFRPGEERLVPGLTWGRAAWGDSLWGGPGLVVIDEGGQMHVLWVCLATFLQHIAVQHEEHFLGINWMAYLNRAKGSGP